MPSHNVLFVNALEFLDRIFLDSDVAFYYSGAVYKNVRLNELNTN